MKILFKNARILTMKDENVFFGNLEVTDNKISNVGSFELAKSYDQVIECNGNLLMPSFKNAHTHSAMVFLRSKADDFNLQDWLFKEIFPRENNLHAGCIKELSKVALLEYISSGISGVIDQYFFPEEFKELCEEWGFRSLILDMYDKDVRPYEEALKIYKEWNTSEYVKVAIGMHAEYTGTEDMFNETAKLLKETKSPFFVHLGETYKEVKDCIDNRGMTPLEYFDSLHFFDNGGAIFHGVYLSDHDMEILNKKDIAVVSCPASNMKLASGIAELKKLLAKKVNIALGTDGASSNNSLDMFKEMYLASGLAKLLDKNPVSIKPFEILKMATVNGAKIMGLDNGLYLEKGQLADIIMIDMAKPSMQPINNIVANLVYSGSKDIIKMTMINGKILYFDSKFQVKEDIFEIYKKVQLLTDELCEIKK